MNKSEAFGCFLREKFDAARDAFAALSAENPAMRVNALTAAVLSGKPDWNATDDLLRDTNALTAPELFYLATVFLMSENPEQALVFIESALEKEPENVDFLLKKIDILERLNRGDDAKAMYQALLRDFPRDERVLCAVAAYVVGYGQTNQAFYLVNKALKINRWFTILQEDFYTVLTALNKEKKALLYADEAAKIRPDDFVVLFERATLSGLMRRFATADLCFTRLDELYGPLSDKVKSMRADALFGAGEYLRAFDTAREISPDYYFYPGIRSFLQKTIYLAAQKDPEEAAKRANRWSADFPDDPFVAYVCSAVNGEKREIPVEYLRETFDSFAPDFDNVLLNNLNYEGPELMRTVLRKVVGGAPFRSILDLGCGTGLCGAVLKKSFLKNGMLTPGALTGVDLSGAMLDEARVKNIYTSLEQADVRDFLPAHPAEYDLIAAMDVLLYFPEPADLFKKVEPALTEKGFFIFSFIETESQKTPFEFQKNGTYKHSFDNIKDALRAAGLEARAFERGVLRTELDRPQYGYAVLAGRLKA